tara:strand:+ start:238 stop:1089 length:852 start_codon:yes stop_codon:yes gene_type:complete
MAKEFSDCLDEDKPISGQKFCCLSFISPEKILKEKKLFFFEEFLKYFDYEKSINTFKVFLDFLSFKYNIKKEEMMADFDQFTVDQKNKLLEYGILGEWKTFMEKEEDRCQKQFDIQHSFKTNVRGLKVRGVFSTQEEAELRAKMLRKVDAAHDIYVGPVGIWLPFEPEAYKTGKVNYLENELNNLMSEKIKNEKSAKETFEARVRNAKKKAIEDNIEKAQESGNKLTQSINEQGELISSQFDDIVKKLNDRDEVTSADIRRELFEGDNVRTKNRDLKKTNLKL